MLNKLTMNVEGLQIAYFDIGDQKATPVVFIHGVPESSLAWKYVLPTIKNLGYRAIAPDLPGFGMSERFKGESSWEKYVEFISSFLYELKIKRFHLIVHNWGGMMGLRWATENQHKILSLVISNTTLLPDYEWHSVAQIWQTPGDGEQLMKRLKNKDGWIRNMKKEVPNIEKDVLDDFYRIYRNKESSKVILDLYRSASDQLTAPYENLRKIQQPVTILWGEKDEYISYKFAYRTKKELFPQANINLFREAGHFIHIEIPNQFNEQIEKHFIALN